MQRITISFEVHDDDTTSENKREYRDVVMDALSQMTCANDDERRRRDKLLNDCYENA